jgi:hypothetical protein
LARGHRHDGYEFVPRVARKHIHLPQFFSHHGSNAGQDTIANSVPVLVVDYFEIVHVHAYYGQGLVAHPLAFSDPLLQHHVEAARVWKLSQRIDQSAVFCLFEGQSVV